MCHWFPCRRGSSQGCLPAEGPTFPGPWSLLNQCKRRKNRGSEQLPALMVVRRCQVTSSIVRGLAAPPAQARSRRSLGSVRGRKQFWVSGRRRARGSLLEEGRLGRTCSERAGPGGGSAPQLHLRVWDSLRGLRTAGGLGPLLRSVTESPPMIAPGAGPAPSMSYNGDVVGGLNALSGTDLLPNRPALHYC